MVLILYEEPPPPSLYNTTLSPTRSLLSLTNRRHPLETTGFGWKSFFLVEQRKCHFCPATSSTWKSAARASSSNSKAHKISDGTASLCSMSVGDRTLENSCFIVSCKSLWNEKGFVRNKKHLNSCI
ncbi:Uncharacterized protein TCM_042516 [Theobroma cacao]|uniref:Uncharacterized protein n=1 Tax=Theobroma cacao TaxID=3641 RepID=A0A061FM93_THECC|nr:Uncharacterized protein TCM_042516 [Theobroma cacao]